MSEVTESLLKELLNNPITVAIYGGGFKPPTKGHFTVAQKALKELPDIDELKIFVGGGVRDGITQNESVQIWKIYQPYLSNKIEVEPVSSPVKAVLDYAKENPDEKVYWILGAREGDEDDLKDIENRTKSLDKYPNIEVKIITTAGGVSGTKTRASISSGNKEDFFNLIPNIQEKEEIWNILSPIIKEGIVDNMKTKIKDFISAVKQEGQETKEVVGLLIHAAQGKIKLTDEQKEYIGNQLKDVLKLVGLTAIAVLPGGSIAAILLKVFKQTHLITPSSMMNEGRYDSLTRTVVKDILNDWKEQFDGENGDLEFEDDYEMTNSKGEPINFELYAVLRVKETKGGTYKVDGGADPLREPAYLEVKFQVDPRDLPQKWEDIYMDLTDVVRHEIEHITQQGSNVIASKEMADDEILRNLINLKLLPKAEYFKLEQEIDAMLQGMYLKAKKSKVPFKDVINDYFDKVKLSKKDRQDILDIWKNRAKALSLPLNELVTSTEIICDNCGWDWKIADGGDDLYTCHKCGHDNNLTLNEGKQVGPLYHYTSADGFKGILQSNRINASEENYLGNELYYISFTRNKNFHKKGSKFGVSTEYRITLDGDKLSNKYKIRPFAYIPGWDIEDSWELDWLDDEPESVRRDFFNATGDYDEQEERIFFKNKNGGIDNIKNYILAVDKVEDLQEGRKKKPDPKKGTGKKPEGSSRRLYTDEDPKDTVGISFKTKEDIVDTLNKKSFKAKSHARQSQIINVIHQRVRAAYNRAKDPETKARLKRGLDYIEKRREMSKKKTERLNKMKEASDPQAGTALPYGSGFAPVKENDPFGIKAYARELVKETFKEDWNLKEGMLSLSRYMIDNGMNIKPLPKIKVIDNDAENASNLLGKTAYYNPVEKSITLFTMNRHPKDVLRSFAHEMVHHMQNLEGRLNNIVTQNTNEDGDLPEIEREAYEKGNMMLRNWEDNIKNV